MFGILRSENKYRIVYMLLVIYLTIVQPASTIFDIGQKNSVSPGSLVSYPLNIKSRRKSDILLRIGS